MLLEVEPVPAHACSNDFRGIFRLFVNVYGDNTFFTMLFQLTVGS